MFTDEDIKNLTNYQLDVFKDVFMTKENGEKLEGKIDKIQTTLDGFAKTSKDNKQEIIVLNHRMKATENWTDKASPKLGIGFKH